MTVVANTADMYRVSVASSQEEERREAGDVQHVNDEKISTLGISISYKLALSHLQKVCTAVTQVSASTNSRSAQQEEQERSYCSGSWNSTYADWNIISQPAAPHHRVCETCIPTHRQKQIGRSHMICNPRQDAIVSRRDQECKLDNNANHNRHPRNKDVQGRWSQPSTSGNKKSIEDQEEDHQHRSSRGSRSPSRRQRSNILDKLRVFFHWTLCSSEEPSLYAGRIVVSLRDWRKVDHTLVLQGVHLGELPSTPTATIVIRWSHHLLRSRENWNSQKSCGKNFVC